MPEFPSMPFWGEKFYGDKHVMVMEAGDVGAYLSLLWFAWQNEGQIPNDDVALMRISRVRACDWQRTWAKVKLCWEQEGTVFKSNTVIDLLNQLRTDRENKVKAGLASAKKRGLRHMKHRTAFQQRSNDASTQPQHTGYGIGSGSSAPNGESPERGVAPPTGPPTETGQYEQHIPKPPPCLGDIPILTIEQQRLAASWVGPILKAYDLDPAMHAGLGARALVAANCNELVLMGVTQEQVEYALRWARDPKARYVPKSPQKFTDPTGFPQWGPMADEQAAQAEADRKKRNR